MGVSDVYGVRSLWLVSFPSPPRSQNYRHVQIVRVPHQLALEVRSFRVCLQVRDGSVARHLRVSFVLSCSVLVA